MGLFSKKPTSAEKQEINAILSRIGTCCKRLEQTDSIDRYFTEWDKYLTDYQRLSYYSNKGIKFTFSPSKIHSQICAEIPRVEKDVIDRGYDRLNRDLVKLSTEKGKLAKASKFFNELEYYYTRLQPSSVAYIKNLKEKTFETLSNQNTKESILNTDRPNYCRSCGALLDSESVFCGKCGKKI